MDAYGVYLTPQSGGEIVITADIDALRPMTKIGVTVLYMSRVMEWISIWLELIDLAIIQR